MQVVGETDGDEGVSQLWRTTLPVPLYGDSAGRTRCLAASPHPAEGKEKTKRASRLPVSRLVGKPPWSALPDTGTTVEKFLF